MCYASLVPVAQPSRGAKEIVGFDAEERVRTGAGLVPRPKPVPSVVRKWTAAVRLPDCLCLHIQRNAFSPTLGMMVKVATALRFPAELDLGPLLPVGPFASPAAAGRGGERHKPEVEAEGVAGRRPSKPQACWYELCAVVLHHGSAHGGHYTSYARMPGGG
jgi:hypothetical protein